jgi:hypothetical protein
VQIVGCPDSQVLEDEFVERRYRSRPGARAPVEGLEFGGKVVNPGAQGHGCRRGPAQRLTSLLDRFELRNQVMFQYRRPCRDSREMDSNDQGNGGSRASCPPSHSRKSQQ